MRKKVKTFQRNELYTESFIQAILTYAVRSSASDNTALTTLVVGGDGRYYSKPAIELIIQLAAANKVNLS